MKKLLALVLSVSMVFCAIPMFAFATTETPEAPNPDAIDLSSKTVKVTIKDEAKKPVYTGEAITVPADKMTVEFGNEGETKVILKEGVDYTAKFTDNIDAGAAKITLKGIGKYKGSVEVAAEQSFVIAPKVLTPAEVKITIPNQMKGDEKVEGTEIIWNGKAVDPKEYTVEGDNSKAGTSTAVIKFSQDGNFAGTQDMTYNYNVMSMDIADVAMYLTEPNAKYTYNGQAHTPGVSLIAEGDKALTAGTDYYVVYENNINAGKAVIKVVGTGLYAGTQTRTFDIAQADFADTDVVMKQDAWTATGSAIQPVPGTDFRVFLGSMEIPAAQYTVAYANNTAIGEATMTIKPAANADPANFKGERTAKFNIVAKALADLFVTLDKDTFAYDGTAKQPAVTVKDGETVLVKDTDYTVEYKDNINAGTASVIVTGKGNYAGTVTVSFSITGKKAEITTEKDSYVKYVQTSKPFNLNAKSTGDATGLTYESSDTSILTVDASGQVTLKANGKATVTIKTVGSKEYEPAEKVVTVTVKPIKPVLSLSSPKKKQVKVVLTKVQDATGYQVRYGRMGTYYYKKLKHIDSEFTKTYTYLNNRTSGRTYYVKVRSFKEMPDGTIVYGNWTSVKKIKSK